MLELCYEETSTQFQPCLIGHQSLVLAQQLSDARATANFGALQVTFPRPRILLTGFLMNFERTGGHMDSPPVPLTPARTYKPCEGGLGGGFLMRSRHLNMPLFSCHSTPGLGRLWLTFDGTGNTTASPCVHASII